MISDLEDSVAMQAIVIAGKACVLANMWQFCEDKGMASFVPPLFHMSGVELPIVPMVELPKDGRR